MGKTPQMTLSDWRRCWNPEEQRQIEGLLQELLDQCIAITNKVTHPKIEILSLGKWLEEEVEKNPTLYIQEVKMKYDQYRDNSYEKEQMIKESYKVINNIKTELSNLSKIF